MLFYVKYHLNYFQNKSIQHTEFVTAGLFSLFYSLLLAFWVQKVKLTSVIALICLVLEKYIKIDETLSPIQLYICSTYVAKVFIAKTLFLLAALLVHFQKHILFDKT